jgi:alkylation response protein AidB-like acyl-CoA dehydrogenase
MSTTTLDVETRPDLLSLPGDEARRIMWHFADRPDFQEVVSAARQVARGPVATAVAAGARHTDEWTKEKNDLLKSYDDSGLTAVFMDPEHGGYLKGPKNLVLALAAFEMAWVDGGAATCCMAGNLALAPIHECGTPEQQKTYMTRSVPPKPGEDRRQWRGAFALTEPLPYVGVNTRAMSGRVKIAEWQDGQEPMLQVTKRGRFITNMAYAGFVSTAVLSGDDRIKTSCMIILEDTDEGLFDRGKPTGKLVHQLSSTTDPEFDLKVPASRIIGGYTIQDGVIVPNYEHGEIIAAVFRRTRVTVGLMTTAKLLSAVQPVISYHRDRFRGGETLKPGTPLHDMGIQQKEDALHRLVDIWATGEASAALGFKTAKFFDDFDSLEREVEAILNEQGLTGRARFRHLRNQEKAAVEYLEMKARPAGQRDAARFSELEQDKLVQFVVEEALGNVLCPATKLWNTGHGVNMMREAVSLMGGAGITEDCPGFIANKWMDAQLEATYEGPEAVQRRQLAITMTSEVFQAHFRGWIGEMRQLGAERPGTGACTVASAMELWLYTMQHLVDAKDASGKTLYRERRQGVTFPMADALCWLAASRQQILDLKRLDEEGAGEPALKDTLPGTVAMLSNLAHVQAARAAGEVGRICAELVYGYNLHPSWEKDGKACYQAKSLEGLESYMPGIQAGAETITDTIDGDGGHAMKAGPCPCFDGLEAFRRLRSKLDGCLTGSRLAKDRAAQALTTVNIPEKLDYPA